MGWPRVSIRNLVHHGYCLTGPNRPMEVTMSKAKFLLAAGLVALTAGCVQETYYPRGTGYYQPAPQPRSERYWNSARADYDRDGIPNRYDRDANGDRIPDRYQGR
jgi:hypothetical protein